MRRRLLVLALEILDLSVIAVGATLAEAGCGGRIRSEGWGALAGVLTRQTSVAAALAGAAYLLGCHVVLAGCGLYRSHRLAPPAREARELAVAVLLCTLPLAAFVASPAGRAVPPFFLAAFPALVLPALFVLRRGLRRVARGLRRAGRNLRDVAIIADDPGSLDVAMRLAARADLGYRVAGVISCGSRDRACGAARPAADVAADLEALLAERPLDEIFLALRYGSAQPVARSLLLRCEQQGITVRFIANLASLECASTSVDSLGGHPVITVTTGPQDTERLALKRALDLVGAAIGLVALLPVFAAIALAIKLDSPGPAIFAQERVGLHRRRFRALKFRTMVDGADAMQAGLEHRNEADGPIFKIGNDPRVTRVGWWLRKLSLDELPQLVNVLRGEMSLVGPRPLPVRDVSRFETAWHKRRFSVKPGITCLWQATRREPTFDAWIRSDMDYIDNWSLGLDLRILLRTFSIVLSRQGVH